MDFWTVIQTDYETVQSKVSKPHTHTRKKCFAKVRWMIQTQNLSHLHNHYRSHENDETQAVLILPASKSGQSLVKIISQEQIQCLHAVLKSHWQVRSLRPKTDTERKRKKMLLFESLCN